jgi:hypothetical protein
MSYIVTYSSPFCTSILLIMNPSTISSRHRTSPAETHPTVERLSDEDSTLDDVPGADHPLVKIKTIEERHLASLKDRDDFTLFRQSGLVSTVMKLMGCTPELNLWYLLALISCFIGGKSPAN